MRKKEAASAAAEAKKKASEAAAAEAKRKEREEAAAVNDFFNACVGERVCVH